MCRPLYLSVLLTCAIQNAVMADDFSPYVTTPMDTSDSAWMEQGLNHAAPTVGLPHAGIINGLTDPTSTFLLQPYNQNNVLFLSRKDQIGSPAPPAEQLTGTLTFSTPTPARSLAFAASSAVNATYNDSLTVHYSDGTPDSIVTMNIDDWGQGQVYSQGVVAAPDSRAIVHPSPGYEFLTTPTKLWETVVPLPIAEAHPVSGIDVTLGLDYRLAIFGVSTSTNTTGPYTAAQLTPSSFNHDIVVEAAATVPEPGNMSIAFGAALVAFLPRRRRSLGARPTT